MFTTLTRQLCLWKIPGAGFSALISAIALFSTPLASAATAPEPHQMPEVRRLAHKLSGEAEYALREARSYARPGDPRERRAIQNLAAFEETSVRFRMQVDQNLHRPRKTLQSYRELSRAFDRAVRYLPDLVAYEHSPQFFQGMIGTLSTVAGYYGETKSLPHWDFRQVRRLAESLRRQMQTLHSRARHEAHYGNPHQQIALDALHRLENLTLQYHHRVHQYPHGPQGSIRDFRNLDSAFSTAERSVRRARFSSLVLDELSRYQRLRGELSRFYR